MESKMPKSTKLSIKQPTAESYSYVGPFLIVILALCCFSGLSIYANKEQAITAEKHAADQSLLEAAMIAPGVELLKPCSNIIVSLNTLALAKKAGSTWCVWQAFNNEFAFCSMMARPIYTGKLHVIG